MSYENIHDRIMRINTLAEVAESNYHNAKEKLARDTDHADVVRECIDIARVVVAQTQAEFEHRITIMTDTALDTVFKGKYKFKIEFITQRNNSEAVVKLIDNDGNEISPMDDNGGTIVNIISFAMKLTMWRLANPRRRNIIVLDEPMKCVSQDLVPLVAEMMSYLSKTLNLQIIMVTHVNGLIEQADNVITVE